MKTNIYVDGLNLYNRSLKGRPQYKWLDVFKMCELLLPKSFTIDKLVYFTAMVLRQESNPYTSDRQQLLLRAIRTNPKCSVVLGRHIRYERIRPIAGSETQESIRVVEIVEKRSDVNLAATMVNDCHKDNYDVAVLVSNDSDFAKAVELVVSEGKQVWLICPKGHNPPTSLLNQLQQRDHYRRISDSVLAKSQFPEVMQDRRGTFSRPPAWSSD